MPAKKVITKEKILATAVKIVRQSGYAALNMRTLAQACKCSTQPIYLSFSGTTELREEIAKEVLNIFNGYLGREVASGKYPEYKAVGMGYIRFAKEEKQLFKYLLMNEGISRTDMQNKSFADTVFMLVKKYGMYQDDATKLHLQMWIFVHGIASMFATGYIDWDEETVSGIVTNAYKGFIKNLKGE